MTGDSSWLLLALRKGSLQFQLRRWVFSVARRVQCFLYCLSDPLFQEHCRSKWWVLVSTEDFLCSRKEIVDFTLVVWFHYGLRIRHLLDHLWFLRINQRNSLSFWAEIFKLTHLQKDHKSLLFKKFWLLK